MKHGKTYRKHAESIDRDKSYPVREAIDLLLSAKRTKFDETAEVAMNLGVDPRHADQNVRGAIVLPHGTGKTLRVVVFAKGDKETEAREAGADEVGGDELAKRIQDGWLEFDRVIASPDMMAVVGRLGKVLGPRGLMPNPKGGHRHARRRQGRARAEGGQDRVPGRQERNHAHGFGKTSFSADQLQSNLSAVADAIMKAKPQTAKGTYLKKVSISSTMGPGIRIDTADLTAGLN